MPLVWGMPTLLERPNLLDCAALCAQLGLSFVELNMNLPAYQLPLADEKSIRTARKTYGVYCTLHLDENFSPCDFNPLVREAYVRTALDAVALAQRHDMPIVNLHMHPGVHFKLPGRKAHLFAEYRDHYLDCLRDFRDRCTEAVGDAPLRVCVENTDGFAPYAREGIALLLESPVFGLTLDIGHAHCAGSADDALYRRHMDRLSHMHIHDADETCHMTLGTGVLDVEQSLRLADARGCRAVLEVKTVEGLTDSVRWLGERGWL